MGFVQVGQKVARVTGVINNGAAGSQVVTEDIDIGLILEVLPRVGADGLISMQIRAERSAVSATGGTPISTSGTAVVIPNIDTTNAESTITAYSGQTVIFGGLIQKTRTNSSRRVPYLADIPLLGIMFRFDRETTGLPVPCYPRSVGRGFREAWRLVSDRLAVPAVPPRKRPRWHNPHLDR